MRLLRVVILTWLGTYCGALIGWVVGAQKTRSDGFIGAVVLGTLALLLALKILGRLGWFDYERRRGGAIGGLCGFALAAPLAAMNLDQPLMSLLIMALVGVGVIAGAGPSSALAGQPQ